MVPPGSKKVMETDPLKIGYVAILTAAVVFLNK
jgi:hypothetical protein